MYVTPALLSWEWGKIRKGVVFYLNAIFFLQPGDEPMYSQPQVVYMKSNSQAQAQLLAQAQLPPQLFTPQPQPPQGFTPQPQPQIQVVTLPPPAYPQQNNGLATDSTDKG